VDVTVVVATFGDTSWIELAERRAIRSAAAHGVPVIHHHAATLHDARNGGLDRVDTEWVCHLDADDELEPGYLTAMASGVADVRAPAVRYVRRASVPGEAAVPKVAGHTHDCTAGCLVDGNWLVVGSLVRTDLVRQVGGWRDFPWSEDWDLWLRCHLAGATFEAIPDAVYRAHVRPNSRNRAPSRSARLAAHQAIAAANGVVA
jgi:glycosyltransferase involved in cell wall biosynthesis